MNTLSSRQIKQIPLKELFTILISQKNPSLSGELLAGVLRRLVEAEVMVGGPYKNEQLDVDVETNKLIFMFFKNQGIQLPALESYLLGHYTYEELALEPTIQLPGPPNLNATEARLHHEVFKAAAEGLATFPDYLKKKLQWQVKAMKQADKNKEIGLIPYFFGSSLNKSYNVPYKNLGQANVYCWASYTIYDDFMDDEGVASMLPTANICMRKSIELLKEAALQMHVKTLPQNLFDRMDLANAWELQYCRFKVNSGAVTIENLPDYANMNVLADRAWGHVAGLSIQLDALDISSGARRSALNAVEQYLVAKQLCDDIHDWKKDLSAGHISPVVTMLVEGAGLAPGTYKMSWLLGNLQDYFWHSGFEEVSAIILKHAENAKSELMASGIFVSNSRFEVLITAIQRSINNSISIYKNQKEFIKNF